MATRSQKQETEPPLTVTVTVQGSRAAIGRLLAGFLREEEEISMEEPDSLHPTRKEASVKTGIGIDKLSELVRTGAVHNYGTSTKMRFSLAELRRWRAAGEEARG